MPVNKSVNQFDDGVVPVVATDYIPVYQTGGLKKVPASLVGGTAGGLSFGGDLTVVPTHAGMMLKFTALAEVTLDDDPDIEVGTLVGIMQAGAAAVTVVAGAGVTLDPDDRPIITAGEWAVITLYKESATHWVATGDILEPIVFGGDVAGTSPAALSVVGINSIPTLPDDAEFGRGMVIDPAGNLAFRGLAQHLGYRNGTVQNTTTATSFFSPWIIPANILRVGDRIRIDLTLNILNNTGGNRDITIMTKWNGIGAGYGATMTGLTTSGLGRRGKVTVDLFVESNGASGVLAGSTQIDYLAPIGGSSVPTTLLAGAYTGFGSNLVINTTIANNFELTATLSGALAGANLLVIAQGVMTWTPA